MNIVQQKAVFGTNYDVGFSCFNVRRHDFIAAGIRWFERWDSLPKLPRPSHAYVITGEDETEEAFGNGVHKGTLSAYLKDPNVAVLIRKPLGWSPSRGEQIAAKAKACDGQGYGYLSIVAMAMSHSYIGHGLDLLTKGWLGHQMEKLANTQNTAICSEVVAEANGLVNPYIWTPADLFFSDNIYEPGAVELVCENQTT